MRELQLCSGQLELEHPPSARINGLGKALTALFIIARHHIFDANVIETLAFLHRDSLFVTIERLSNEGSLRKLVGQEKPYGLRPSLFPFLNLILEPFYLICVLQTKVYGQQFNTRAMYCGD